MSKRLAFERYLWFHQRLKLQKFPKLKDLEEKFEISARQAQREIENMRLYFDAPIKYNCSERGYFYTDEKFEFPATWISEEELITLIIAKRLSVTIPDKIRKEFLQSFFNKISVYINMNILELEKKISLKNIRYYLVKPDVFDSILYALSKEMKLKIVYRSVFKKEVTKRIINPLHMVLYMGNWHIIAFCESKNKLRDFTLSRIKEIEILEESIDKKMRSIDIKEYINQNYGIFWGDKKINVTLKFKREISEYILEQVWFPGQKVKATEDGGVLLSFPVTDFREVIKEILSFGSNVEVIEPLELREIIIKDIFELSKIYQI